MRDRHQRAADDVSEFRRATQHTGHRQHEGDLHDLRRLEGEAADRNRHLRAVARRADDQHDALQQEAEGNPVPVNIILVHAQDHLTMAQVMRDMAEQFMDLYQTVQTLKENK